MAWRQVLGVGYVDSLAVIRKIGNRRHVTIGECCRKIYNYHQTVLVIKRYSVLPIPTMAD